MKDKQPITNEPAIAHEPRLADVLPFTHEVLVNMPISPAYHSECLWNPDGNGWIPIGLIHPMNDLDISFVEKGIVAFPKNIC